jgi:glycine betaine/proline transport system ATP-binding protein
MPPSPEISVRDLWKVFGKTPAKIIKSIRPDQTRAQIVEATSHVVAVRGVSFDVFKAQTFVVMGLSGSGKSTLVRCLSRLTDATAGQVIIGGQDVLKMDEKQLLSLRRHRVSMVFQNFGLFPHRRVIDNVAYGLEVQGVDRRQRYAQAAKMIELVGLSGWEKHYPKQLSGGMQQRVGLARALAVDPEILLFDEPFSALDPLIRREMQDELIRLQTVMHKTVIFITHDFAEALRLGDRIAIMKDGEFVQVGTPEELVLNPQTDYVRAFTQDAPRDKVIAARTIMKPCPPGTRLPARRPSVQPHTKLEDILPLVAASDDPVPVCADEAGDVMGYVDRACVIQALVGP